MKIKIKGLVFAGAAAAIMLSAGGAYAAKSTVGRSTTGTFHGEQNVAPGNPGVVTSEKYTKAEYEWVANKVDDAMWAQQTGETEEQLAARRLGLLEDNDYYPSMNVMKEFVDIVADDLGGIGEKQPIVDTVGTESAAANGNTPASTAVVQVGWKGSGQNDTGTWQSLDGSGYVMIETDNSGTDPVQHVRLRADSVHTTNDVANNDTINTVGNASKLATAGTVQIKQSATNKYQVSSNQEWTDVSNAVTELSGGYADVVATATGGVTIDIDANKITTSGAQLTASEAVGTGLNGDETDLVTALAVKEYVASTGLGGIELPAMNDDCSKTDSHCSLVTSWNNTSGKIEAAWVVMAGAAGTGSNHTVNGIVP